MVEKFGICIKMSVKPCLHFPKILRVLHLNGLVEVLPSLILKTQTACDPRYF
jgi:hypothetical protein